MVANRVVWYYDRMVRWRFLSVAVLGVTIALASGGSQTRAKNPGWQPGEHPRLIVTAAEKNSIVAKLTTPGTVSSAVWDRFLTNNFRNNPRDYADNAFLYWVTGSQSAGQQAINVAEAWMNDHPAGLEVLSSSFNAAWYNYMDLLLTYDFTADLLTSQQRTNWLNYIALQGAKCDAAGTGYAPGNMNTLWMFCEYASAELLEGENVVITVVDEPHLRGSGAGDRLNYVINGANFKINDTVNQPTGDYTENADYRYAAVSGCGARCIDWSLSGPGTKEPAVGTQYYVSYTFTPDVAAWKSNGRTAFENHLNYQWHDGYYRGGLNPYGNLVAEMVPFFVEMFKRDIGLDYGRHADLKKIVDMYLYSKLPSTNAGVTRRFNTINDTGDWTNDYGDAWLYPLAKYPEYRSWLRPFVAWSTAEYANDPAGYDQRYLWLWTQAYRQADGSLKDTPVPDWREALWINDSLATPYLNTVAVPMATWPTTRYFRGQEVIYASTNDWNQPNSNAALMSFIAGNHNYLNEHDQGDSGSFTFFSLGEDWSVDPGYADPDAGTGYRLQDHNAVGIDGHGYATSGVYGVPGASADFGGFAHFDDVALTADASAAAADLTNAWTLTATPYVQRDQRYLAMVNGSQPSYLVIADDIQKDAANHSYEWYMHSGLGNTVTISGPTATITGGRTGAALDLYSLGPETAVITKTDSTVGNIGPRPKAWLPPDPHPLIQVKASGVPQARFLHLLIPGIAANPKPAITSTVVDGGTQAAVTWPDGTTDTILWRYDGGTITGADGVVSDAKVTIIRRAGGQVTGLIAMAGRSVTQNGTELMAAVDGAATTTVVAFGPTAGVYATDAARLRLGLPFVTAATLEDGGAAVPVWNDGTTAYINGGRPLADLRRGDGVRYRQDFNDRSNRDLFRFNLSKNPTEQFGVASDALELRQTPYEWPSFSRRDSTPWRRSALFPTMIPPLEHGDGIYSFRYRFENAPSGNAAFRVYFRTTDRNPIDWVTNQDYVRVELQAVAGGSAANQVILGQRVNGPWAGPSDNDILTATLPPATVALNDANWHSVIVRLVGDEVRVTVDGAKIIEGSLSSAPAAGYLAWSVVGSTPVLLDDVEVDTIDETAPAPPTAGTLIIHPDGTGALTATFGQGSSTDMSQLKLYESASPIAANTDPATLTSLATTNSPTSTLSISGARQTLYHAMAVQDSSGNRSVLVPLAVDLAPPATVTDLQAS